MLNSSRFANNPTSLDISRSKFDLSWRNTLTCNAGRLIPIYHEEILPGDTFSLDASFVIRSTTPITPVMDDLYADIYFFFVPNKMTLSRAMMSPNVNDSNQSWKAFIGAQDSLLNCPVPATGIRLPHFWTSDDVVGMQHTLLDYFGMPISVNETDVEPLEILAYCCVWNNWFRDPNGGMNAITYSIAGDGVITLAGMADYGYDNTSYLGYMEALPVCRMNGGFFTSALPWPQRNSSSVLLPLGDSAPVVAGSGYNDISNLHFYNTPGSPIVGGNLGFSSGSAYLGGSVSATTRVKYSNLEADLSKATAASVNAFRYAVQLQRWYEALARGGNSYSNLKQGMFGVTGHDVIDDRPEFLGAHRVRLNMNQVNGTSDDNLGNTGAFSLTTDKHHYFTKSFDDWGVVIGVMAIRPKESYSQGLQRKFKRFDKFQFYWPQFANIGEQEILNQEIYYSQDTALNNRVFGYQEAWAEYRYHPDQICGYMRPSLGNQFAAWTYGNNFSSTPSLPNFINGDDLKNNVDQTLFVSSATAGFQFFGQFFFDVAAVRPMPTYSIPGLVDHH